MYELFKRCFPDLNITHELFTKKLINESSKIFTVESDNKPVGFSIINGGSISMLCVAPEARGQGFGKSLLDKSEEFIKSEGHKTIKLGLGNPYLFQGVPVKYKADGFFTKYGYNSAWVSADLTMRLNEYHEINIPECPDDVSFGFIDLQKNPELIEVVNSVIPSWIPSIKKPGALIYTAKQAGKIVGFCLVSFNASVPYCDPASKAGSIGCVGVISEARKKGIGMQMVKKATDELKFAGCDEAYIDYTHIANWYGKLGYKVCMEFWMGSKTL